jgi:hypothetical protein
MRGLIVGGLVYLLTVNSLYAQSQVLNYEPREIILTYLNNPIYRTKDLLRQITHTNADFNKIKNNRLYLNIPASSLSSISKICSGDYKIISKNDNYVKISFSADKLKIDPNSNITVDFNQVKYSLSLEELIDFAENKFLKKGALFYVDWATNKLIPNHGYMVSNSERSLSKLADSITKADKKERIAQDLLDFVTKEIEFNNYFADSPYEFLRRPDEILMSKTDDCSGKTILYASLLEQKGINYLIAYSRDHVYMAVEGDFSSSNGLEIIFKGKTFHIAETTLEDFQIGYSNVSNKDELYNTEYVQGPDTNFKIIKISTGKVLPAYPILLYGEEYSEKSWKELILLNFEGL